MNAATSDVFKPNSATNTGRGDFLRVTFNANTLPNNAFLYLFISNRFMDGDYQNYMMEVRYVLIVLGFIFKLSLTLSGSIWGT
jgi:hypothetical protein